MRRADIARSSAVTGGADYLFTLLDLSSEGPASDGDLRLFIAERDHHLTAP
jgi:hypothetical protein